MIERYTLPEMGALWTDEARYRTWLEVETAAAEAMARHGIIPAKAAEAIREKGDFDVKRIDAIEAEINHDVIAFLTSVSEFVGPMSSYLHYGMTSSDMLDTALSVTIQRAAKLIDDKLTGSLQRIEELARKHKMTPCMGRTHGVLAEPTTLGLKFAVWYTELSRRRHMFRQATEVMAVGKISGAVGNFANLDPEIEADVCHRLGLSPAEVSTQVVQRDRHAQFVSSLALIASSIEKFATEIRSMQRTEIGEMAEGFSKKQKGSSAMPHKKNPITAERLCGIARLVRGHAVAAMENIPLWGERDIAHSSVERVILPDSTIIVDYGLQKFNDVLDGLVVDPERMMEIIFWRGGVVFSQRLLLKLTGPVGDRDKAYRMVQRNAMAATEGKGAFRDLVKQDQDITEHMTPAEIDECFDLGYYTRNVDKIFKRVFG